MTQKTNLLYEKCLDFSVRIIKLYEYLMENKIKFVLPKQILGSGTSIGAQIGESKGAQSGADFITKLHISLKEARETEYWLDLLRRVNYIDQNQYDSLFKDLNQIIALLISTLKSTKARLNS